MIQPANRGDSEQNMAGTNWAKRFAPVLAFAVGLIVMAASTGGAHAATWKCDYRDDGIGPYTWGIKGAHQMKGEVTGGRATWLALPDKMTVKYQVNAFKSWTLPMSDEWTLDYKEINKSGSKYLFDFGYKFRTSDPIDTMLSKVLAFVNKIPGGSHTGAVKYAGKFKSVIGIAKTILEETQTVDFHMWASNSSAGAIKYEGDVAFRCL